MISMRVASRGVARRPATREGANRRGGGGGPLRPAGRRAVQVVGKREGRARAARGRRAAGDELADVVMYRPLSLATAAPPRGGKRGSARGGREEGASDHSRLPLRILTSQFQRRAGRAEPGGDKHCGRMGVRMVGCLGWARLSSAAKRVLAARRRGSEDATGSPQSTTEQHSQSQQVSWLRGSGGEQGGGMDGSIDRRIELARAAR